MQMALRNSNTMDKNSVFDTVKYSTKYGNGMSLKYDVTSLKYAFTSLEMWKLVEVHTPIIIIYYV